MLHSIILRLLDSHNLQRFNIFIQQRFTIHRRSTRRQFSGQVICLSIFGCLFFAGLTVTTVDAFAESEATTGWLASAEVPINTELAVQLQYGASDNVAENSTSASLGATYDLGNDVSLYVFATENSSDEIDDESEVGVGISYVF